MKLASDYALEVKQLALDHNNHFQSISEDGVIDYGEALNTREVLAHYHQNLQAIQRQVAEEINQMHVEYGERILVAQQSYAGRERVEAIRKFRIEEQQALVAYENVIKRIEFLKVGIPQNKDLIEDHIAELEAEMNQAIDTFEDVSFEPVAFEDTHDPVKEALLRVLNNWQAIKQNIDERQNQPQPPEQKAYDTGVERMVDVAIGDIQDVLDLLD